MQCQYTFASLHFYCQVHNILFEIFSTILFIVEYDREQLYANCINTVLSVDRVFSENGAFVSVFLNLIFISTFHSLRYCANGCNYRKIIIAAMLRSCTNLHSNTCEAFFLSILGIH